MNLFVSALPLLEGYVKLFQSGTPLIHKLHDKQLELLNAFLVCFIKPEVLKLISDPAKKIKQLDVEKKINHLSIKSTFVGEKAKELIASTPKLQCDVVDLKGRF